MLTYNLSFEFAQVYGLIQNELNEYFYFSVIDRFSKYQIRTTQNKGVDLIDQLNQYKASVLIIQLFDHAKYNFLVLKKFQNEWHFYRNNDCIQKITRTAIPEDANGIIKRVQISQFDFAENYLGQENKIYCLKKENHDKNYVGLQYSKLLSNFYAGLNYEQTCKKWQKFTEFVESKYSDSKFFNDLSLRGQLYISREAYQNKYHELNTKLQKKSVQVKEPKNYQDKSIKSKPTNKNYEHKQTNCNKVALIEKPKLIQKSNRLSK
ncbi:hypothetical protein OXYTRIMIC_637 [Oxytricha trifallax]|uniref:Uncharacterized protein n=1 Tax=Oxytricha trifallax TaxID=1172189 RepID=A0A073HZR6_9SPIT|nr:hypothetical protein OXYTRIMIC_637 [Oxytricha trifallax]